MSITTPPLRLITSNQLLTYQATSTEIQLMLTVLQQYLHFLRGKTTPTQDERQTAETIDTILTRLDEQMETRGIGPTYRDTIKTLDRLNKAETMQEFQECYEWFIYHGIHITQASEPRRWILLEGMV
ncbi:hypothetical protein KSC_081900 [Ktedonobacter sp. SOSP1-52]|uniref:hypothetical protein n=1 Tax=Ktedonobacter sp. SOSP1-52 TaxID=2778366 RepID=UPI00191553AB|nr:hypothetical protein [Ktedonobacter sp. SOSP1-52]GHO69298.1 hypothetical protein KSC_081900 [Ktedonobacter sp. SOSP1-52]